MAKYNIGLILTFYHELHVRVTPDHFFSGAEVFNLTVSHDDDIISFFDGGIIMGNDDDRTSLHQFRNAVADSLVGLAFEVGSSLIKDQISMILYQSTGNVYSLGFTA